MFTAGKQWPMPTRSEPAAEPPLLKPVTSAPAVGHFVSVLKPVEPATFRKVDLEKLKQLILRPGDVKTLALECGLVLLRVRDLAGIKLPID